MKQCKFQPTEILSAVSFSLWLDLILRVVLFAVIAYGDITNKVSTVLAVWVQGETLFNYSVP
jgi:hypothetical protein